MAMTAGRTAAGIIAVAAGVLLAWWLVAAPAGADEADVQFTVDNAMDIGFEPEKYDCIEAPNDPQIACTLPVALEQIPDVADPFDSVEIIIDIDPPSTISLGANHDTLETGHAGSITVRGASDGDRQTIEGSANGGRIFAGPQVSRLTLENLELRGGDAGSEDGGAVLTQGGNIEVVNSALVDNRAERGGAIWTGQATVTITGSELRDNTASQAGGAVWVTMLSDVVVEDGSVLADNHASNVGGAIHLVGSSATVTDSVLEGNSTATAVIGTAGGAIGGEAWQDQQDSIPSSAEIARSELRDNASFSGGALAVDAVEITDDTTLDGNTASGTGGAVRVGEGGGEITDSTVTNNSAGGAGGAVYATTADIEITRSMLSGNEAAVSGGAVNNTSGDTVLRDSVLTDNVAGETGGAVRVTGPVGAPAGALEITGSTLAGNDAQSGGGGAVFAADGPVTVTTSTVTGNSATGNGGGLHLSTGDDDVVVTAATIADNTADGDGSQLAAQRTVSVERSALAGDGEPVCDLTGQGAIDSQDHNLASDASCQLDQADDQVAVEPLLGALDDGGAEMPVRVPEEGSPLVDAGGDGCDGETDQRGTERPQGEACDIGAVEWVPTSVARVSGDDRVETGVALAEQAFPNGADTVVLATGNAPPDSLSAAPLASAVEGPLLLTRGQSLEASVGQALAGLGADEVIIVGGTMAVPQGVESDLLAQGLDVERVFGADRYETAAEVAAEIDDRVGLPDRALVAASDPGDDSVGWPDALAAGSYAGIDHTPILLTATGALPGPTAAAVDGVGEVEIVGGTAVVSASVEASIDVQAGAVDRLAGSNRWETAVEVADAAVAAGVDPEPVWVATGWNWPDGLAAGAAAAAEEGVLVLVDGDDLDNSPQTRDWIAAAAPNEIRVAGGPVAVSDAVLADLEP